MVTGFQPVQAERIPVPLPLATVETGIERNGILGVGAGNNQRRFTDHSTPFHNGAWKDPRLADARPEWESGFMMRPNHAHERPRPSRLGCSHGPA